MKKITFLVAALVAVVFSANAQNLSLPWTPDLSGIGGASEASTSSMPKFATSGTGAVAPLDWFGDVYTNVYNADKKLKFGSSSAIGSLNTKPINAESQTKILVSFKAGAWLTGAATADVKVIYGTQEKTITATGGLSWPVASGGGSLTTYSVEFDAIATPTALRFESTPKVGTNPNVTNECRFFMSDLSVSGTSGVAEEVAAQLNLFVSGNVVNFTTEEAVNVGVYSMTGAQIFNKVSTVGANAIKINNAGLYIVKVGTKAIMVRI